MKFLVYSSHNESTIRDSLGMADYSYYFVMRRYLPLLATFGEVEVLPEPPDDAFVAAQVGEGPCVYLSFTPPDKVAAITACPVIVVFAWEFSTIPFEEFTRPEDNWVRDLKLLGRAITHSSYAAAVVRKQLGEAFDIPSIPAPLWDSCAPVRAARTERFPAGLAGIELNCRAIDSASYELSNTHVRPKSTASDFKTRPVGQEWDEQPIDLSFQDGVDCASLIGFNKPESWGVWSKPGFPWLFLNQLIVGHIELAVTVQGYVHSSGQRLQLQCGTGSAELLLTESFTTHVFELNIAHPTNVVAFFGIIDKAVDISDPRDIGFGLSALSIRRIEDPPAESDPLCLQMSDETIICEGFHQAESWGRWSAASSMRVYLPKSIRGDVNLTLNLPYSMHNDNHSFDVTLGGQVQSITLLPNVHTYSLEFSDCCATAYLSIDKVRIGGTGSDSDTRELGIGLSELVLSPLNSRVPLAVRVTEATKRASSSIKGGKAAVLYTAILNPMDARKNWEDMITAFVYAFHDKPNVTLLLKITHHDFDCFFEDIFTFFTELHPFQCRLIFIHGFLPEAQYAQLLEHSHFIVNTSTGEGQCLPLMEFMSAGVPAIAPAHTAMLDYINPGNAFVVDSSSELAFWPQDPRNVFRANCQRINWETLRNAFVNSEKTFRTSPGTYREMSRAAIDSLESFCSMAVASEKFEKFLASISARDLR